MSRLHRRLLLDLILTIMLVFEMSYSLTGNTLHEAVGFSLFVGVAVHLILSRKWIASTTHALASGSREPTGRHTNAQVPKMTSRRKGLAIVAALLLVDVSLLATSSLIISTTLTSWGLSLWKLNISGIWTIIHYASAYGLCALTTIHLAMHWTLVAKSMRVSYDPSRRQAIGYAVGAVATLGTIAIGHAGFSKTAGALEPNATNNDTKRTEAPSQQGTDEALAQSTASERITVSEAPSETTATETTQDTMDEASNQPTTEEQSEPVGNCPLCHNHCPLSAPSCDRPYEAGLI